MSQLVMHALGATGEPLVPILIKIQRLQRLLLIEENRRTFRTAWNWVDAYLRCEHGAESDMYLMLRQALMARCALLLLDGIDEGGQARQAIEKHVTEVLAPQGHAMLVTSRPAGLKRELFARHFAHLELTPLTDEQQQQVIEQRIGEGERSARLLEYVRAHIPTDTVTGGR